MNLKTLLKMIGAWGTKKFRAIASKRGYQIVNIAGSRKDVGSEQLAIESRVSEYTMTSPERLYVLMDAVQYVIERGIPGSIVECGVWKGGSMMAAALRLNGLNHTDRDLYLFDTFEGMTAPTERDIGNDGKAALETFDRLKTGSDSSDWARASIDEVQKNMTSTNYPVDRIHYICGKVEDTIPEQAPRQISILRLDTDWYESTLALHNRRVRPQLRVR